MNAITPRGATSSRGCRANVSPETTDEREGFIHPHADRRRRGERRACASSCATTTRRSSRATRRLVPTRRRTKRRRRAGRDRAQAQYRNMKEYLDAVPLAVELAARGRAPRGPRADARDRSAAARTARASRSSACRRRTSSRAASSTTRTASGSASPTWAPRRETIVHLAQLWADAREGARRRLPRRNPLASRPSAIADLVRDVARPSPWHRPRRSGPCPRPHGSSVVL